MARLFALLGNRADVAPHLLSCESARFAPQPVHAAERSAFAWGAGFYQGAEVLVRRRPFATTPVTLVQMAGGARTDCVVGCVGSPSDARAAAAAAVPVHETAGFGPFRWRKWLFAATDVIPPGAAIRRRMLDEIPGFLRSSMLGTSDGELAFFSLLAFLHDASALVGPATPTATLIGAMRGVVGQIEAIASESEGGRAGNFLVTDGDRVVAFHGDEERSGVPTSMAYRSWSGTDAVPHWAEDFHLRAKVPLPTELRFSLLAADFEPLDAERPEFSEFTFVPSRQFVVLSRDEEPRVEPA